MVGVVGVIRILRITSLPTPPLCPGTLEKSGLEVFDYLEWDGSGHKVVVCALVLMDDEV